ncbi:MAG: hypothetical protein QXL86_01070 [Candidatus Aenigmatarchaeota archaeon]
MLECPNCKSRNIKFMPWLGMIYECKDCGYRGPIAIKKKTKSQASFP